MLNDENIGKQSLQPEPKTLFALKRDYLPLSSPIAGDVQTRRVGQPNDVAAVGVHFINVGVSGAAAEDDLQVVGRVPIAAWSAYCALAAMGTSSGAPNCCVVNCPLELCTIYHVPLR